ncbi:MAG: hypothetical protein R3E94_03715 [Burkholderiaceae bacterium]
MLAAIGIAGFLAAWFIERQIVSPLQSILSQAEMVAAGQRDHGAAEPN